MSQNKNNKKKTKKQTISIEEIIEKQDIESLRKLKRIPKEQLENVGKPVLHFAIQKKVSKEMIEELIKKGANVKAKTNQNQSVLHYACQYRNSLDVFKLLVEKGADVNAKTTENQSVLQCACQYQAPLQVFKLLVEKGADIHIKNNYNHTILFYTCFYPSSLSVIKFLAEKGVDINAKNNYGLTAFQEAFYYKNKNMLKYVLLDDIDVDHLYKSQINKEFVESFSNVYSINQEMSNLLTSDEISGDFKIKCNDGSIINAHKLILLTRFNNDETILQKFVDNCYKKDNEVVKLVISFLYTGFVAFEEFTQKLKDVSKNYKEYTNLYDWLCNYGANGDEVMSPDFKEKEQKIEDFFKEIGLDSNWMKSKKGRKPLLKDLDQLYQNEETKDFTIICEENGKEKEIKTHKLILMIRSELFKGMFLSVNDSSNKVHDYSGKPFETINQLIYFIYHDNFDGTKITKENIEEYEYLKGFYQLNENSIIDLLLLDVYNNFNIHTDIEEIIEKQDIESLQKLQRIPEEQLKNVGKPILHFAIQKKVSEEMIEELIDKGVDVKAKTKENQSVLHYACQYQSPLQVFKLLVEEGADVNAKTNQKQSVLHYACQYRNSLDVFKLLVEKGADVNAKTTENQSVLQCACQYQAPLQVFKLLVEKGADIHIKNNYNHTILFYTCFYPSSLSVIKLLAEKGVDINAKNNYGLTAFQEAFYYKNKNMLKYVLLDDIDVDHLYKSQINKEFVESFSNVYSINQEMSNLLTSDEISGDFKIKCNDGSIINAHKLILLTRFNNDETILQKFVDNCHKKDNEVVKLVISFLYTGFVAFEEFTQKLRDVSKNYKGYTQLYDWLCDYGTNGDEVMSPDFKEKEQKIEDFFKEIGLDSNWMKSKRKKTIIERFRSIISE
ncbi:ankyrin repeat ph and sec7 domain containing protein secg-related [Anaeramoeba ignava]|uniref:Ankyrin repeat ph and sec7 domain containing protein secg-related n=1 Tax=Anaeramoeba ignava TaxID=1746090 RepID=A0A9Q0RHU8_ANAIG|nr:ankyrin repeat ph and sec7 domain containing protein secg-related [Anaeramoeba ignava]